MNGQETAETLALQALGWLLAQEELLPTFLGATGAAPADLPRQARDPQFLGAVLDFLLLEDGWIMGFCDAQGLPYDAVMRARAHLPGGVPPHWT